MNRKWKPTGKPSPDYIYWLAYLDEDKKRVFLLNGSEEGREGEDFPPSEVATFKNADDAIRVKNQINQRRSIPSGLPSFMVCLSTARELLNLIQHGQLREVVRKKVF